jgi:hypothetical protein
VRSRGRCFTRWATCGERTTDRFATEDSSDRHPHKATLTTAATQTPPGPYRCCWGCWRPCTWPLCRVRQWPRTRRPGAATGTGARNFTSWGASWKQPGSSRPATRSPRGRTSC